MNTSIIGKTVGHELYEKQPDTLHDSLEDVANPNHDCHKLGDVANPNHDSRPIHNLVQIAPFNHGISRLLEI